MSTILFANRVTFFIIRLLNIKVTTFNQIGYICLYALYVMKCTNRIHFHTKKAHSIIRRIECQVKWVECQLFDESNLQNGHKNDKSMNHRENFCDHLLCYRYAKWKFLYLQRMAQFIEIFEVGFVHIETFPETEQETNFRWT